MDHTTDDGLNGLEDALKSSLTLEQLAENQMSVTLLEHELFCHAAGRSGVRGTVAALKQMLDSRDYSIPWLQNDVALALRMAAEQKFLRVATHWMTQGWNVIPGDLSKTPLIRFGEYKDGSVRITADLIRQWSIKFPWAEPLLLPASNPDCPLIIVDGDHKDTFGWITQTFGITPWMVSTGRKEGGKHFGYRRPQGFTLEGENGVVGPDLHISWDSSIDADGKVSKAKKWGRTKIDVKSGLYVVAPGGVHRSGLSYLYEARDHGWLPSREWIEAHVPLFSVAAYKTAKTEHQQRKTDRNRTLMQVAEPRQFAAQTAQEAALRVLAPSMSQDAIDAALTGGKEPFVTWCESNPEEVNLSTWWGLATNLAAVHGGGGKAEFHRLSALSSAYQPGEADATWARALAAIQAGHCPTGYRRLQAEGYLGLVPPGATSPAACLKALAKQSSTPQTGIRVFGFGAECDSAAPPGWTPKGWEQWVAAGRPDPWDTNPDQVAPVSEPNWDRLFKRGYVDALQRAGYWLRASGWAPGDWGTTKCGFCQIVAAKKGKMAAALRLCRTPRCWYCSRDRIASQFAAIIWQPLTRGASTISLPLGQRPVLYFGAIERGDFDKYTDTVRKAAKAKKAANPSPGGSSGASATSSKVLNVVAEVPDLPSQEGLSLSAGCLASALEVDGYVVFDPRTVELKTTKLLIVSTTDVGLSKVYATLETRLFSDIRG